MKFPKLRFIQIVRTKEEKEERGDNFPHYSFGDIDAWCEKLRKLCQNEIVEYELDEKNRGSLDYGRPRSFYVAEFARKILEMLQE